MAGCCGYCGFCCTALSTVNPTPGICQTPSCDGGSFSLTCFLTKVCKYGSQLASTVSQVSGATQTSTATPINATAGMVGAKQSISTTTLLVLAAIVILLVIFWQ